MRQGIVDYCPGVKYQGLFNLTMNKIVCFMVASIIMEEGGLNVFDKPINLIFIKKKSLLSWVCLNEEDKFGPWFHESDESLQEQLLVQLVKSRRYLQKKAILLLFSIH